MPVEAATLRLVLYPAPALRLRASAVEKITDEVRAVAARMLEVMREHEGIGMAAPQVGLPWRLFVADVPEDKERSASGEVPTATRGPVVYVNPVLSAFAGAPEPYEEGCLSLPEIRGDVLRPPIVTLKATDLHGREFTASAGGLLARCWQHEVDHLDGVLIIDRMTQMSRLRNRAKVRALEKESGKAAARR
ncbi:MAG: peptide deformylase [Phycisphaerae bacterium]|nr:peptide deformylase [Phycisphaerae bacterium]